MAASLAPGPLWRRCPPARSGLAEERYRAGAVEARYRRDSLDQVRALLGQEEFGRAHARGMALSTDEAFSLVSA
jgi:hypothetical protein